MSCMHCYYFSKKVTVPQLYTLSTSDYACYSTVNKLTLTLQVLTDQHCRNVRSLTVIAMLHYAADRVDTVAVVRQSLCYRIVDDTNSNWLATA
eukprot:1066-Heterococcus_DN1.PRE.1